MTPSPATAALGDFPEGDFPEGETRLSTNGNHPLRVEVAASGPHGEVWFWAWLLLRRRGLLTRALAWGLTASILVAFLIPKRYDSTTRLMPPDGQSSSNLAMIAAMAGKSGLGMGSMAGNLLGLRSSGALFVDILRSRTVEDRIISRFDLRRVYGVRYWVDARRRLGIYTEIAEDRKSEVITIRVTDRDPQRAAAIAQAYVNELDHLVAEVSTSSARRERVFIEDRLTSVKRELDRASQEFSQFASKNATLDISTQGKAMVEAAARLQGELIASQSELEGLEQIYTGNNVRVRSFRARVDELRRQLDKLGGTAASGNQALPDSAALFGGSADSSSAFPSIRQLPLLGVRWTDLYRQAKIEETVYELLTQQYELAKIEEAKEIPTVKILDVADVPEKKSTPHRMQIVLLGGLLTLVAATAGIVFQSAWNAVDVDDPRKALAQSIWSQAMTSKLGAWVQAFVNRRNGMNPPHVELD
ncbi:MAG: GNVR domain-containing protein [Candidatus Sulfotelmatobacter sp.]